MFTRLYDVCKTDQIDGLPESYYRRPEPSRDLGTAGAYFATLAHEATDWTGHGTRLDRIKKFADRKADAFEGLVAELGNVIID